MANEKKINTKQLIEMLNRVKIELRAEREELVKRLAEIDEELANFGDKVSKPRKTRSDKGQSRGSNGAEAPTVAASNGASANGAEAPVSAS